MSMVDGRPRADAILNGRKAYVTRIYVHARESWTGPKVLYVVMHGVDAETGEAVFEIVNP